VDNANYKSTGGPGGNVSNPTAGGPGAGIGNGLAGAFGKIGAGTNKPGGGSGKPEAASFMDLLKAAANKEIDNKKEGKEKDGILADIKKGITKLQRRRRIQLY
jgi:hypothetical protein